MAHDVETSSFAIASSSASVAQRKQVILLCSEELRFVACGLEEALASRGWRVRVEYGQDARPWVQKLPVERPSLRVLCVPGTVDPELAATLHSALAPDPDADLHILGVDDSRGLVQEIERLAGVRTLGRRSIHATRRLSHATLVEQQVAQRRLPALALATAAAVMLVFGGSTMIPRDSSGIRSVALAPAAHASDAIDGPTTIEAQPILAAAAPFDYDEWEPLPPEEEVVLDLDEDEPAASPLAMPKAATPVFEGIATPLGSVDTMDTTGEPPLVASAPLQLPHGYLPVGSVGVALPTLPPGFMPVAGLPTHTPLAELPQGFLPVAGLPVERRTIGGTQLLSGSTPDSTHIDLPTGFMPVAGLMVTPGSDPVDVSDIPSAVSYDPFIPRYLSGTSQDTAKVTADPFAPRAQP